MAIAKTANIANNQTRSSRAGLIFPVGRIASYIKAGNYAPQTSEKAAIAMSAILELLVRELLDVANRVAIKEGVKRINPSHIKSALELDEDFKNLATRYNMITGQGERKKKQQGARNDATQQTLTMKAKK